MSHHSNETMKSMNHGKPYAFVLHSNINMSIGGHEINEPTKKNEEEACEVVDVMLILYLD